MLTQVGLHILVALIAGAIGCLFAIIAGKLSENGMETLKNWLWYAIFQAELFYGGKTGPVKLQSVYNEFVKIFPKLAKKISFNTFSDMVDAVLENVNETIKDNDAFKKLLEDYENFKEEQKNEV